MERQHIGPKISLFQRCSQEAEHLRAEAEKLTEGREREEVLKKARRADTAAHIDEWLRSPSLQPPK